MTSVLPVVAASDEEERLAVVRRYDILDTPPDGSFDHVTAVAADRFDVPIAIVSIVDRDRIWFKSHHGLDVDEIGRDPGLCASAILQGDPWVVTDAATDPRTLANPLVAGELGLRFYAGIPLTMRSGHRLGTLCVIDTEPRQVRPDEITTLEHLAAIVVNELELRLAARSTVELERQLRHRSEQLADALQQIALPDTLPELPGLRIQAAYLPATAAGVGGDWYDAFALDGTTAAVTVGDVSGHGLPAAAAMGQARNAIRAYASRGDDPSTVLHGLDSVMLRFADDQFATVAYFVIDGTTGDYRAANAGHPTPALVRDAGCSLLDWPVGPPVGAGLPRAPQSITGTLEPGDALVLYTDGLVERRGETLDDGMGRLVSALAAAPRGDLVAAALDSMGDDERADDVAVLVVERLPA